MRTAPGGGGRVPLPRGTRWPPATMTAGVRRRAGRPAHRRTAPPIPSWKRPRRTRPGSDRESSSRAPRPQRSRPSLAVALLARLARAKWGSAVRVARKSSASSGLPACGSGHAPPISTSDGSSGSGPSTASSHCDGSPGKPGSSKGPPTSLLAITLQHGRFGEALPSTLSRGSDNQSPRFGRRRGPHSAAHVQPATVLAGLDDFGVDGAFLDRGAP